MPLASSDDYGKDEIAAEALLQRHKRLEDEIAAYRSDMQRLEDAAAELGKAQLLLAAMREEGMAEQLQDQAAEEVVEERAIPQVKVLYSYEGHGMSVAKGEVRYFMFIFFVHDKKLEFTSCVVRNWIGLGRQKFAKILI